MANILETICRKKHHELIRSKEVLPPRELYLEVDRLMEKNETPRRSLAEALKRSTTGIIAEFKRKSPSLGWIKADFGPNDVIPGYQQNGASAISILTDGPYFGGRKDFISMVRSQISIPILRKDFILDEYQVFEAKNIGADAILLIASCLSQEKCRQLAYRAQDLELEVLLEVHEECELEYINDGVTAVGVNNRDLKVFKTDIGTSCRLGPLIPNGFIRVSESGLSNPDIVRQLRQYGFEGFLMGERFMKENDPAKALGEFIRQL